MKIRFAMLAAACLISSCPAAAFDYTFGDIISCAGWLKGRAEADAWIQTQRNKPDKTPIPSSLYSSKGYLIGFIEGYDWACPLPGPTKFRGHGIDMEAVFDRVDAICKAKGGDEPLRLVALDLVKELDPQHRDVCTP